MDQSALERRILRWVSVTAVTALLASVAVAGTAAPAMAKQDPDKAAAKAARKAAKLEDKVARKEDACAFLDLASLDATYVSREPIQLSFSGDEAVVVEATTQGALNVRLSIGGTQYGDILACIPPTIGGTCTDHAVAYPLPAGDLMVSWWVEPAVAADWTVACYHAP